MVNKAALLPGCEGDTGTLHTEQAHLIDRRIFTSSDLIKGRRVSHAHTQLAAGLTCRSPASSPSPTNSTREAVVTLQELKRRGVIVLSPLKQNKLRSDTQHMSFDIKPYGPGAETAIYLKVFAVIGHENFIGSLARYARPPRGRAGIQLSSFGSGLEYLFSWIQRRSV